MSDSDKENDQHLHKLNDEIRHHKTMKWKKYIIIIIIEKKKRNQDQSISVENVNNHNLNNDNINEMAIFFIFWDHVIILSSQP